MIKKIVTEKIKISSELSADDMQLGEWTALCYIERLLNDEKFLVDRYKFWSENT